jgi:hypothetical protein
MYSGRDDRISSARFPDSEIPGSKPTCRLPEAYRRQATSFFASVRQGIHRVPFVAWLLPTRLRLVVSRDITTVLVLLLGFLTLGSLLPPHLLRRTEVALSFEKYLEVFTSSDTSRNESAAVHTCRISAPNV